MSNQDIIKNLKALYAEWLLIPSSEDFLLIIKKAIDRLESENNN